MASAPVNFPQNKGQALPGVDHNMADRFQPGAMIFVYQVFVESFHEETGANRKQKNCK